jgi:hypothetical protein
MKMANRHTTRTRGCIGLAFLALALGIARGALAQHDHHPGDAGADSRVLVAFPEPMREHTKQNMRDHLRAIAEIQGAMARRDYTQAAEVAEQRLGMTSLKLHGAHEVAKFMPDGMQAIGTSMHRSASQFAIAVSNAAATGELEPALAKLAQLTAACVACHDTYRLH